jgi:hypothetical protein
VFGAAAGGQPSGLQPAAEERWPESAQSCGQQPAKRNVEGGWMQGRAVLRACGRRREMEQQTPASGRGRPSGRPDTSHVLWTFLRS